MAFFFWAFVAIVFGAIWFFTLIVFLASRFAKSKAGRWLGFLPFAGMSLCALAAAFSVAHGFYTMSMPSNVFEESFAFAPTEDVREMKSQNWVFGDNAMIRLKFKADPRTISRIAAMGLRPKPLSQANLYDFAGSDLPDWWKPNSKTITHLYAKQNRLGDFGHEQEMLCYNEPTQQAYYSFQGID